MFDWFDDDHSPVTQKLTMVCKCHFGQMLTSTGHWQSHFWSFSSRWLQWVFETPIVLEISFLIIPQALTQQSCRQAWGDCSSNATHNINSYVHLPSNPRFTTTTSTHLLVPHQLKPNPVSWFHRFPPKLIFLCLGWLSIWKFNSLSSYFSLLVWINRWNTC